MKKITMMLAAALLATASFGQATQPLVQSTNGVEYASLASARAKITQVIDNPADMTAVMKSLSAADQKSFLAEVNAAILAMPGSDADRTAKFVAVTDAALAGAQKGNALTLVAEVFATVPPISLTAVNESLGAGLMNRAADSGVTYTDEQYTKIAQTVMEKVNERVAGEDNSGVRSGFAALMLIRGSNSPSNDSIYDAILAAMPADSQNDAKVDWFPAALGRGREQTYEPMLAVVDGDIISPIGEDFDVQHMMSIRTPGPSSLSSLLADISGGGTDSSATSGLMNPVVDATQHPTDYQLPPLGDGGAADDPSAMIGHVTREIERGVRPTPVVEPRGYQYQSTRW
ncbi:MAG: hypothetical protein IJQ65_04275 [Kiritimatiellae bacterium]|nr:hypothetical protein [Kiritimatiellia bacterium]